MIITVGEIIGKLHEEGRTCVLTFQLENAEHLLKIYFKRGEVCRISLGDKKDLDCLPLLRERTFKKYSFIDDDSAHIPATGLHSAEILDHMKTIDRVVAGAADTVYGRCVKVEALEPDVIGKIEEAFVEAAGPVATLLLDDCLKKIGCPRDSQLSGGALKLIVRTLSGELPEKERPGFLRKFRM
jgi:hypothetical protein